MTKISQTLEIKFKDHPHKEFKRGEIIYNEGDHPSQVWFVSSGLLGLFHTSESGKETFLRVFGKGYILGHRTLIANQVYHASAIALTSTHLIPISKHDFLKILKEDHEFHFMISEILASDLGQAELRLSGLSDKTASRRIIESILYLRLRFPTQNWTRKEIAEYSASTMETVTRVMTDLESAGLLVKDKRRFEIPDVEALLNSLDE